jgi:hypothetical protein
LVFLLHQVATEQRLQDLAQKEARLTNALQETKSRLLDRRSGGRRTTANPTFPDYDVTDLFAQESDAQRTCIVQGGRALRTWSFANPRIEFVQVLLKTEGRPLE